jgi:hypothetical protein
MLQSKVRTATFVIVSTALAATTAGAQPSKGGVAPPSAPVPHVAPAPPISAVPAPHISAAPTPHISVAPTPHISVAPAPHISVAPQISTPRVAPPAPRVMSAPRAVPQQLARPEASPGAVTRHVETPRVLAAPRQEKQQIGGRDLGRANLDAARRHREPTDRTGRNVTLQNPPNQKGQLAGGNRAAADRVLRNPYFADKSAAGDRAARMLARSTFHGRFFDHDGRHHRHRPIVIGWAGPLFWPYAHDDFVD